MVKMNRNIFVLILILFRNTRGIATENIRTRDVKNYIDIEKINLKDVVCTNAGLYKHILHQTLLECADECIRRSRCVGTNYHQQSKVCSLKDEEKTMEQIPWGKPDYSFKCVSVERAKLLTWWASNTSPCHGSTAPCGRTERCSDVNGNYECYVTECYIPPIPANASVRTPFGDIGFRNAYFCKQGFSPSKDSHPAIVCKPNGNWTETTFRCLPDCKYVDLTLTNIIEPTKQSYLADSITEFQCTDGFLSDKDGSSKISRQCFLNGTWEEVGSTCKRKCDLKTVVIQITSGEKTIRIPDGLYVEGDEVEVFCGSARVTIYCIGDGTWFASANYPDC